MRVEMRVEQLTSLALAGLLCTNLSWSDTCEETGITETPASQFIIDVEQGTVIDRKTNLMWQRCLDGTVNSNCDYPEEGMASIKRFWQEAMIKASASEYADYSDWRIPNAVELMSIHDYLCIDYVGTQKNHGLNFTVFPIVETGSEFLTVWTSTLEAIKTSIFINYSSLLPHPYAFSATGPRNTVRINEEGAGHYVRLVRNVAKQEFEVADTEDAE